MILKDRLFTRREPSKDAKLFILFCEGKKREPQYFNYFKGICTKIKFEIIPPLDDDNNSPTGLYETACLKIIQTEENPNPKYNNDPNDEIWFVIDTDDWGDKIQGLKELCNNNHGNWFIAQSNPCFEVWLYYHFKEEIVHFEGIETPSKWKQLLNDEIIPGGFDSRKHPLKIGDAIKNAKLNFENDNNGPSIGSTEVYKLAENFFPYVSKEIQKVIKKIQRQELV